MDSVRMLWPTGRFARARRAFVEIWNGLVLWWRSRNYEAVVTDPRPHAAIFSLLQRLPGVRKRRHLMLECLWIRPANRLARWAKSLQLRAAIGPHSRAVIYARHERDSFHECFGIPRERFVFIPYHTTLHGYPVPTPTEPAPDPYIFAGGSSERDYATLFAAVTGLEAPLVVAIRDRRILEGLEIPSNVEIITTDHAGFLQKMQDAFINVVPLSGGALRSAGQQTFLNAMALGTVVIVTDDKGASDYIENWKNGVVVAPGDVAALRAAIVRLWEDRALAQQIATGARQTRQTYGTERILGLIIEFLLSDRFADPRCEAFTESERDPAGPGRRPAASARV